MINLNQEAEMPKFGLEYDNFLPLEQ